MTLLSGATLMPFFPLAALFNDGTYWRPRHVELPPFLPIAIAGGSVGIEDMMFLFIAGTRSWFFATVLERSRWIAMATPATFLRRSVALTAAAFMGLAIFRTFDIGFAPASYVLPAVLGVGLLCASRENWPLALGGALGSTVLAVLELHLWFAIWPDFHLTWSREAATSRSLLGVPVGDLLWWIVVGAAHPLVMAWCAGVTRFGTIHSGPIGAGRR